MPCLTGIIPTLPRTVVRRGIMGVPVFHIANWLDTAAGCVALTCFGRRWTEWTQWTVFFVRPAFAP